MDIQDRRKTLTAEELRRRYNLDALDKDRKAIQLVKNTINKTEIEFQKYISAINSSLMEYPNQADGNITAWFFNGIPTEEQPIFENKEEHIGDLYYDRESGLSYQYKIVNYEYVWEEINNYQIKESLAVASSAPDTVDNKRITFLIIPQTPYNIGDIWINNGVYYRCRSSRDAGTYNIADWLKSTEYTDDLVALQTKAELDQFKTTVTENYVTNATLETTTKSITGRVEETYTYINNHYYNIEQIDAVQTTTEQAITEIKNTIETDVTATQANIDVINETLQNGVEKVSTSTGYTFDSEGLHIKKSDEDLESLVNNTGIYVNNDDENMLTANADGVKATNLEAKNFFILHPFRLEETVAMSDSSVKGIGFFYIGDE